MPELSLDNKGLLLSMEDAKIAAEDPDTKLYLSSILGMEYDGSLHYSYSDTRDFVRSAFMVRKITDYLESLELSCKLDDQSHRILDALVNSEAEFAQSREMGLEIQNQSQLMPIIPGFVRKLKSYQIKPVNHAVAGYYTANFSVPGSGKTTIAYATFAILKANSIVNKIMVIGPRSSFMPWEEEYEACFGKKPKSFRIIGSNQSELEQRIGENNLILLTYQTACNITSTLIDVLSKFNFLLILDESHHVKRFGGGLWSESVLKIALYAKRRLILTGTPMPNSLLDLWSQFTFLWPFKNVLGEPLAYKTLADGVNGLDQIKGQILPFYTRVTKNQLNLPPISFRFFKVPLNRVQQAIYSALAAKTLAEIADSPKDKTRLRYWRRNKVIRLLQAASNPCLLTKYSEEFRIPPLKVEGFSVVRLIEQYSNFEIPSKIIEAEKLVRELVSNGEKVIVWTTFIHNIKTLAKMLADKSPIIIFGDIPRDEKENELVNREKLIREFKTNPNLCILIANPNSLAESVSLHKVCKNAIYVDRTFNAGQYIQSLDRIHRIGLEVNDKVTYYIFLAKDTIDEVVDTRLEEKYRHMLDVLDDDLPIIDFDTTINEISDADFERDFQEVHKHLLKLKMGGKSD